VNSPSDEAVEAVAHYIAQNILLTAWDGLKEGSCIDRGFPVFCWRQFGGKTWQGGKEDVRNLARAALSAASLAAPIAPSAEPTPPPVESPIMSGLVSSAQRWWTTSSRTRLVLKTGALIAACPAILALGFLLALASQPLTFRERCEFAFPSARVQAELCFNSLTLNAAP